MPNTKVTMTKLMAASFLTKFEGLTGGGGGLQLLRMWFGLNRGESVPNIREGIKIIQSKIIGGGGVVPHLDPSWPHHC